MVITNSLEVELTSDDALGCLTHRDGVRLYANGHGGANVTLLLQPRHIETLRMAVRMLEGQIDAAALARSVRSEMAAREYCRQTARTVAVCDASPPAPPVETTHVQVEPNRNGQPHN